MFASNGAAVILNTVVPPAEVKVLLALAKRGESTVAELLPSLNGMTQPSLFSFLKRLHGRKLVSRDEKNIMMAGTTYKRVFWQVVPAVLDELENMK